jgi:hypothetical protein
MILVFVQDRVRVLCKKHDFLVMDMLVTAVAIALLCLAAWLLYKRFSNRFKSQPVVVDDDDYDDYEEEAPAVQEAVAEAPATQAPPPVPEPKKEA